MTFGHSHRVEEEESNWKGMFGVKRKSTLVGLAFLMFMGIAVYFRLWAIDYNISIDDSELLRYVPWFETQIDLKRNCDLWVPISLYWFEFTLLREIFVLWLMGCFSLYFNYNYNDCLSLWM